MLQNTYKYVGGAIQRGVGHPGFGVRLIFVGGGVGHVCPSPTRTLSS
jgi:hypothetical protein